MADVQQRFRHGRLCAPNPMLQVAGPPAIGLDMNEQRPAANLERFFGAPLAETDPELAAVLGAELLRQQDGIELIASENAVSAAVLEAQGSVLTNKYAEGYPGRRYYGGCVHVDVAERLAIDRAKTAVRLRVRQRAAALRRTGESGRLPRAAAARRHHPRHEPRRRRPPDARRTTQPVGQVVSCDTVWRATRGWAAGLRGARTTGARRPATADHRRRLRLSPLYRLRPHPTGGRRGRRVFHGGHGAFCRAGRRRPVPQSAAARARGDHNHAQDAARPARRHDPGERRGDRPQDQLGGVPRPAGWPADARDRRQGRGLRRGVAAGVPGLPEGRCRERQGAGGHADTARLRHRHRRHRLPSDAGRSASQAGHRQGGRGQSGTRTDHGEQERHPVRSGEADCHLGRPPGLAGRHHTRVRHRRVPRDRPDDRRGAGGAVAFERRHERTGRGGSRHPRAGAVRALPAVPRRGSRRCAARSAATRTRR